MALGNIGVPVGTELVVPAAGALTATGHLSNIWLTGLVATLGEIVGAMILYTVGFVGGRPFVMRYGKYLKLGESKYDKLHAFYEKHGAKMVFLSRFIPVIRGVASLPAGVSRMQKRYFLACTAAGSAIFCFGLAFLGNAFGHHLDAVMPYVHKFSLVIAGVILLGIVIWFARAMSAKKTSTVA
jgi:membrane protein DedA with SNARE-associated domain